MKQLMNRASLAVVLVAVPWLAACTASAPVRYYQLDPVALQPAAGSGAAAVLVMGPLSVPEYLQRSRMVRRGDGAEVVVDEFHRWAEPLGDAVPRVLAANVDGLADDLVALAFPARGVQADYRLTGTLLRFDADTAGTVYLTIQWSVADRDGGVVVSPRTSRYQAEAAPDPGAMAAAMSDLLARLGRDVVRALEGA